MPGKMLLKPIQTQNPDWADMIEVKDTAEPGDMGTEDNKILNQEEIDSLLGYSAEDDEYHSMKTGVQAILNSAMVSYERLPMLEIVFDRLVRMMATSLRNFTQDNVEVSLDSIESMQFRRIYRFADAADPFVRIQSRRMGQLCFNVIRQLIGLFHRRRLARRPSRHGGNAPGRASLYHNRIKHCQRHDTADSLRPVYRL